MVFVTIMEQAVQVIACSINGTKAIYSIPALAEHESLKIYFENGMK